MNKKILSGLIIILALAQTSLNAQGLQMPREFLTALENNTRTLDGKPGSDYWINHSDYKLDVDVSFENDTVWISGKANIRFYNESPDNLNMILLRSYPDIFADAAIRNYYIFPFNETKQVQYSDLILNGDTIPSAMLMQRRTSTNLILQLQKPLESGGTAEMEVSWKYHMHPRINIRQGVYANDAIYIAYWYPQVAVYDDMYGWDMTDYAGTVEFYNDFNNYDVSITLPAGYLVWAGGALQNPEEVYSSSLQGKVNKALESDDIISIISQEDLPVDNGDKETLTWKFKSENTPDFSFAASKTHLWDASGLEVEEGRRVLISTVYPESSKHYAQGAAFSRKAVEYLSFECPGIPYPWPSITVFNSFEGGGGMETPMMVNNGDQQTELWADEVIFHEIAHSYLPFLTGTNERRFAWMDEGWATYQGMKWSNGEAGGSYGVFKPVFNMVAGTSNDLPLMIPTYSISDGMASNYNSYGRSAQAFLAIEDQLGTELMNKAWKLFTERWQYKHPAPWDLFAIFEEVANDDLKWLIKPWYYEFKSQDIGIETVDLKKKTITLKNIGGLPLPVNLTLEYEDGTSEQIHKKPEIFKNNCTVNIDILNTKGLKSIKLGGKYFYDMDLSNDVWTK